MWKLGAAIITLQAMVTNSGQVIARLQPLAGGTVHHIFGWEDDVIKLSGLVVGSVDAEILKGLTKTAEPYLLESQFGAAITKYFWLLIKSVQLEQQQVVHQSIRTDLLCTAPVYEFEIEGYRVNGPD